MDPRFQYIYFHEVESQCSFAINAYQYLHIQLRLHSSGTRNEQLLDPRQEIFRTIHSFLTHTGNMSRLLWPGKPGPGPERKARKHRMDSRALHLRHALGLPDQGHPLESREVRNYLEHFDEDLDTWAADNSGRGLVALDNLGPLGMIQGHGIKYIRCFDTKTQALLFLNKTVNLGDLNEALKNILPIITQEKEAALTTARNKTPLKAP
jgi:hypothetical protein